MNKQEDYKSKYLKYKTKYLNLLNQSGGNDCYRERIEYRKLCELENELNNKHSKIISDFKVKLTQNKCDTLNCRLYTYYISKLKSLVSEIEIEIKKTNNWKYKDYFEDIKGYVQNDLTKIIELQKECKCNTWI
jgi:hypothetical protein